MVDPSILCVYILEKKILPLCVPTHSRNLWWISQSKLLCQNHEINNKTVIGSTSLAASSSMISVFGDFSAAYVFGDFGVWWLLGRLGSFSVFGVRCLFGVRCFGVWVGVRCSAASRPFCFRWFRCFVASSLSFISGFVTNSFNLVNHT